MKIHMALGPGLLESVYTVLLQKKLQDLGFKVEREVPVPVVFEGVTFQMGFRADLIIEDCFWWNLSPLRNWLRFTTSSC